MARDHSPRERQRRELQRKSAKRAPYERILIVCEGSKTEPLYFRKICAHNRLPAANIQVHPSELGTLPLQVVEYAQVLFEKGNSHRNIQPRAFDRVYAVFDRDDHRNYLDALRQADSLNGKMRNSDKAAVRFCAIASVPCFELWLLLHFEDVHAPMGRKEVVQRLKRHLPGYEKNDPNIFSATRASIPLALQRADRLAEKFTAFTDPQPYTGIAELVRVLTTLKNGT